MIRYTNFRFVAYQAVTFYVNLQFATGKVLGPLMSEFGNELDGEPLAIPVPVGTAPEIPRIILSSKDQSRRVEISSLRVDVRWQRKSTTPELSLADFSRFSQRVFASLHKITNTGPGRLALVVGRFQLDDTPGKALARHFCKPEWLADESEAGQKGPLNRPEEFELHAFKKFTLDSLEVNSWVRCKTPTISVNNEERRVIFVEQDLNTLAEELLHQEFDDDAIRRFHERAISELEAIVRLYFPDSSGNGAGR